VHAFHMDHPIWIAIHVPGAYRRYRTCDSSAVVGAAVYWTLPITWYRLNVLGVAFNSAERLA
jgi:hypothetical protein